MYHPNLRYGPILTFLLFGMVLCLSMANASKSPVLSVQGESMDLVCDPSYHDLNVDEVKMCSRSGTCVRCEQEDIGYKIVAFRNWQHRGSLQDTIDIRWEFSYCSGDELVIPRCIEEDLKYTCSQGCVQGDDYAICEGGERLDVLTNLTPSPSFNSQCPDIVAENPEFSWFAIPVMLLIIGLYVFRRNNK